MDIKTLRAVFTGGSYCKTRPLTRQDYGITLQFVHPDLPETYQVHFSNSRENTGTAKTQIATADGVVIPDEYLITGKTVYAWAFVQLEGTGRTRCMVEIPVAEKPTVIPEEPTPQQRSAIDEAIEALNTGVSRSENAAGRAEQSAENAAESEKNAAESARLSKLSEDNAKDSEDNAAGSAEAAGISALNAAESERKSKGYADAAETSKNSAETAAEHAEQAASTAGYMFFYIDARGHLIYQRTSNTQVDFYLENGHLYVEAIT